MQFLGSCVWVKLGWTAQRSYAHAVCVRLHVCFATSFCKPLGEAGLMLLGMQRLSLTFKPDALMKKNEAADVAAHADTLVPH